MDRSKGALTWTELRVGVVVIASLVVLAFTILYIGSGGGTPFSKRYVIKALMTDVNGLKAGAPVRLGGVEVGTVTRVDFAKDGRGMIEVTMKLDRKVKDRVTSESQATLGALGLLGEKAVDINTGTGGVPIPEGGYVSAAAEDPFKGLLADASESTAHLKRILARMDAGEGLIGKALRDEELYDRMIDVSKRLQVALDKLESTKGPLGRLMNDEQMSADLARTAKGINDLVARVDAGQGPLGVLSKDEKMAADLKSFSASLSDVTGKLQRGEGSLGKLMTDESFYRQITELSTHLDRVLARMEKGEGSMGKLMQDPDFYNNLNGAAKDLRTLVEEIRKDPQKYLRVKLSVF